MAMFLAVLATLAWGAQGSIRGGCALVWESVVPLTKLRDLNTETPTSAGRPLHLSAGSGAVVVAQKLFVVPDDELHLGEFPLDSSAPGKFHRIFEGTLPDDHEARKKAKPDWEALTLTDSGLLLVPSGSAKNRTEGALLPLGPGGVVLATQISKVSFSSLFRELRKKFPELNIEGAVYLGNHRLRLVQRGNGPKHQNAMIDVHFDGVRALGPRSILSIHHYELPSMQGVPLSFTDLALLGDGRMVAVMAAEKTKNVYDDGEVVGSAVALLGADFKIQSFWPLDQATKIEGLHAEAHQNEIRLLMVSDPDDEQKASELFSATLQLP